jgi:hypothetical protein
MTNDFWHKQEPGKPLFPELLWSKPENKLQAGKLLIVGGNAQGFAAVAEAYGAAAKAGAGTARVLLPDSLQKTVGKLFPEAGFAPSTPSGSFAERALGELLASSGWADGVLLAGDTGRNSETAILFEKLIEKYQGQLTVTKDAMDYFTSTPIHLLQRPDTTLVLSFAQLQKIGAGARFPAAFTFGMDLVRLVEALHAFTQIHKVHIITKHNADVLVAVGGQVSTIKSDNPRETWRVKTAAVSSVWWLQNPSKPFEALTSSLAS